MQLDKPARAAFAQSVPVWVRAAEDGSYDLVDTETDVTLSTGHARARDALAAALDLETIGGDPVARDDGEPGGLVKKAVLRTDGDPSGAWRWLDATAVEDDPIGGARIGERAVWELAESLNAKPIPVAINGGGSVGKLGASEAHGDAKSGGDHLANGWAHVGIPLVDKGGRTHLFLFGELVAPIAAEVDAGRLAFGSVYFGFVGVDDKDNSAVQGAVLISHALTNDPAVTVLSAGSERVRGEGGIQFRARRTWETNMADDKKTPAKRGPATEKLRELASALGVDITDEMDGDAYFSPMMDAISALKQGAKVEQILEGGAPAETPEPDALAASAGTREEPPAERAPGDPLMGADAEAFAASVAPLLAMVFGKPDAPPADLLAELEARKDELAAFADADSETPEEEAAPGEEPDAMKSARAVLADPKATLVAKSAARVTYRRVIRERAANDRKTVREFEARDWLAEQLTARGKSLPKETHAKWVGIALTTGRGAVTDLLDQLNTPPKGDPMAGATPVTGKPAKVPTTMKEAADLFEDVAREQLVAEEAARAVRTRSPVGAIAEHHVRSRAQKLARKAFPDLFTGRAAG